MRAAVSAQASGELNLGTGEMMDMLYDPIYLAFWAGHLMRNADPSYDQNELNHAITQENAIELMADLFSATDMDKIEPEKNSTGRTGLK